MTTTKDHVTVSDGSLSCARCGAAEALPTSGSVRWIAALLSAFESMHRRCRGERRKKREAPAPRSAQPARIGEAAG